MPIVAGSLPASDADLLRHADWIASETLATSVEVADADGEVALKLALPAPSLDSQSGC